MSDFHEIWKWDEAQKRLEFARRHGVAQLWQEAGEASGDVRVERLVAECAQWRRMYEAKSIEYARLQKQFEAEIWIREDFKARLQKRVEELEKAK